MQQVDFMEGIQFISEKDSGRVMCQRSTCDGESKVALICRKGSQIKDRVHDLHSH